MCVELVQQSDRQHHRREPLVDGDSFTPVSIPRVSITRVSITLVSITLVSITLAGLHPRTPNAAV